MARRSPAPIIVIFAALAVCPGHTALAFGPLAHRIAGLLAEPELCEAARAEVVALGGAPLAELGVWADTIRSEPEWRRSAPWHYMNVDDPPARNASAALASIRAHPKHVFWPDSFSYTEISPIRLTGHHQVTDSWLAELARRKGSKLATMDEGLAVLWPETAVFIPV